MLFGYPIEATAQNWLHDCLVEMLMAIHENLDAGTAPTAWPDIIPELHRTKLCTRTGLRDRLDAYREAVAPMEAARRQQVATCLIQQNRIDELCSCTEDCEALDQLPVECHTPTRNLFNFAFALLTEIGVRDLHYSAIYNGTKYPICPFCGCEYFDAPGAPREDLDHYLPKSRYPFAAANLQNLVPMGMKCNEVYKKAEDILRCDDGNRRFVFYPYANREIGISLENSVLFADEDAAPKWQIDFRPESKECAAWDAVFHFRERIVRDVLDPYFKTWLGDFRAWCKSAKIKPIDDNTLISAIECYAGYLSSLGYRDRAFIKAALFATIYKLCSEGNERLTIIMRDLAKTEGAA